MPSGSFTDYQLNSHHTANKEEDQTEGNNIYPADSHYQQQQTPSLYTHTTHLVMLLNCSISPDLDEQWQNQTSQCSCPSCYSSLYGILRIQHTSWVENHDSLCLRFAENSLGLQPLLRSKTPAKRTRSLTLPEHQYKGCGSLLHHVEAHRKNCSNMRFQQPNMQRNKTDIQMAS